MNNIILTINAGSSSIKFSIYAFASDLARHPFLSGQIDGIGASARLIVRNTENERIADIPLPEGVQHAEALNALLGWLDKNSQGETRLAAIGHRVVHGGELYSQPVRVDAEAVRRLEQFVVLAPLHQPHNLNGIKVLAERLPGVPQVACFDTAFHRTQPPLAQLLPCRVRSLPKGSSAMASTASPTSTSPAYCPNIPRVPKVASSLPTSATVPACAPWSTARARPRRWVSPPSTA